MKLNNITTAFLLSAILSASLTSCRKDDSKKEFGFSKIYMPQAIAKSGGTNNLYPVPSGIDSSTYNYRVNTTDKKIDVILGATLSGPSTEAYSVDIKVNNDTVQRMLSTKVLDSTHMLMPASMYSLPTSLDVSKGSRSGTFNLAIDIAQLKMNTYAGKKLVLAVKLDNSTKAALKYELNPALSTTIVVVDVNALVIGPAVNITTQYIKNAGNPFVASAFQPSQTRWGNLRDWNTNAAARSHGGFGGFSSDNGGVMNMESGWGSPQILNGKIYQTLNLPAGRYAFDFSGGNWSGGEHFIKDSAYAIAAPNLDTLPDYRDIRTHTSISYQLLTKSPQAPVVFQLSAPTKVTVGVVVNYVQTEQGFKSKQVMLYNYPKAL